MMPKKAGRFSSETVWSMVTSAPVKIPALPSPATARPTFNRAHFEDEERNEKDPFDVEQGVELAKEQLECAAGQKIR